MRSLQVRRDITPLFCNIGLVVSRSPAKILLLPYPTFSETQKRWMLAQKITRYGAVRRVPEWQPESVRMALLLTGVTRFPVQAQSSWRIRDIRTSQVAIHQPLLSWVTEME